jgi:hydrogenase-4 component E
VRTVAAQGLLLALVPVFVHEGLSGPVLAAVAAAALVKGGLVPWMLRRALAQAHVQREMTPFLGFVPSLIAGGVVTACALLFATRLPLAPGHRGTLIVPASLATLAIGFLILATRRKALVQVVGFLVLENGVFLFGMLLLEAMPFLVEIGVLLDVLAGVFIMGIVVDHIRNEFSSLDTEQLTALKGL